MKKQLLTSVVLTTGLLVLCLKADVSAGEGIKDIYRKFAKGKIEKNNDHIKDVLDWARGKKERCIKKFLAALALSNEELKNLLKTHPKTDDSSTLKNADQVEALIKKHDEKIKKELLLCIKKINDEKRKLILQCTQDSKSVVEGLEGELGKKLAKSDGALVSEQPKQQKVSTEQGSQSA